MLTDVELIALLILGIAQLLWVPKIIDLKRLYNIYKPLQKPMY